MIRVEVVDVVFYKGSGAGVAVAGLWFYYSAKSGDFAELGFFLWRNENTCRKGKAPLVKNPIPPMQYKVKFNELMRVAAIF